MTESALKTGDLEILAWIINELYNGGGWWAMETERPEINEVCDRLGIFEDEPTRG